jgi:hypothetical protein
MGIGDRDFTTFWELWLNYGTIDYLVGSFIAKALISFFLALVQECDRQSQCRGLEPETCCNTRNCLPLLL